jgi:hypothetical protein
LKNGAVRTKKEKSARPPRASRFSTSSARDQRSAAEQIRHDMRGVVAGMVKARQSEARLQRLQHREVRVEVGALQNHGDSALIFFSGPLSMRSSVCGKTCMCKNRVRPKERKAGDFAGICFVYMTKSQALVRTFDPSSFARRINIGISCDKRLVPLAGIDPVCKHLIY